MENENQTKKYYLDFCPKGQSDVADHDYALQSKWFDSEDEAVSWYHDNFDYSDPRMVEIYLVEATWFSDDDYDICRCKKLRGI